MQHMGVWYSDTVRQWQLAGVVAATGKIAGCSQASAYPIGCPTARHAFHIRSSPTVTKPPGASGQLLGTTPDEVVAAPENSRWREAGMLMRAVWPQLH